MHYPFHIRDLFFSFLCWMYTIVVYIVYPCRRCANSVCHWLKVGKRIQQIIIVCSSSTDRKLGCVIMFVLIRCCPYPFSTYQNSHPARITKSSSPLQCICLPTVLNKWKEGRICFWIEWRKKKKWKRLPHQLGDSADQGCFPYQVAVLIPGERLL